ncbi:hypothetical protein D9Q98_009469 [Chlorella vulgaris]|uniref:Uncharacterized protein n=1 Tax=Chlorella vulgaris TaxID=3077 RepID=A0A9D4TF86_CHLVU|nr:hypothetical protein D9Q98_009469 [Chlorella vulgaris]
MGLLSCCWGGETQHREYSPLPPTTHNAAARAAPFGEGALRQDVWASKKNTTAVPEPFVYSTSLSISPPVPPTREAFSLPASSRSTGGGWGSEPSHVREAAAALAAQQAESRRAGWHLPGLRDGHTITTGTQDSSATTAGVNIFWHSSYDTSAPHAGRRARKQSSATRGRGKEQQLLQAPAFGTGALTKWH